MYSTCLSCHSTLGHNGVIERFPVGRRVAFDAARGRLWAVCARCRRWNLAPLEERWEAVEDCERLFPRTRMRVSTENVGLARLADGTELVRIGRPKRVEFAGWRYGNQMRRRQKVARVKDFVGFGMIAGTLVGTGLVPFGAAVYPAGQLLFGRRTDPTAPWAGILRPSRIAVPGGDVLTLRRRHLMSAALVPAADAGWGLRVAHDAGEATLLGYPALGAARYLLARLNHMGGDHQLVQSAVRRFDGAPSPDALFGEAARIAADVATRLGLAEIPALVDLPPEVLLALEMAASEERERQAMEVEVTMLEREWREAEEVAAIADALFVPSTLVGMMKRLRGGGA